MNTAIFYHAGCSVCVHAEQELIELIGVDKLEIVNIGEQQERIAEAERAGVKSVPALVTRNGQALHINYGAAIEDVKA